MNRKDEEMMRRENVELLVGNEGLGAGAVADRADGARSVGVPVELGTLVEELTPRLARLLGESIDLVTRPSPEALRVRIEADDLVQIIVCLAQNARDAMPVGGRLVLDTAAVHLDPERMVALHCPPGPYAVLSVSDTGGGTDAEIWARMFEPFFSAKVDGSGRSLDLSVVYALVKRAGGHLAVETSLGDGSTVRVYLPRAPSSQEGESRGQS